MSGGPCRNPVCHRERATTSEGGGGYCHRCYSRWRDNGYPASGPPPPRVSHLGGIGTASGRLEDYVFLRDECRLAPSEAARRLGVGLRTVQRYENRLRGAA